MRTVVGEKRGTSRSKESAERRVLYGTYGLMMSFRYDGISCCVDTDGKVVQLCTQYSGLHRGPMEPTQKDD